MFWPRLRRCANGLAMTVYEQGSGLADHHPHPTIPSLLHLHLDPALLGEVTTTNTQCPTTFSRSSNQAHNIPIQFRRLGPHQQAPL